MIAEIDLPSPESEQTFQQLHFFGIYSFKNRVGLPVLAESLETGQREPAKIVKLPIFRQLKMFGDTNLALEGILSGRRRIMKLHRHR